jgi:hypothetical protein
MQEPFPALRSLVILSDVKTAPVIPDSLLGGSAPHLQFLGLKRILFHSSGPIEEAIGKFVATRQLSGLPVAVSYWDRSDDKW